MPKRYMQRRKFKFLGYRGEPYYGEGVFTKGLLYKFSGLRRYPYVFRWKGTLPDAVFIDDSKNDQYEELQYFKEIL